MRFVGERYSTTTSRFWPNPSVAFSIAARQTKNVATARRRAASDPNRTFHNCYLTQQAWSMDGTRLSPCAKEKASIKFSIHLFLPEKHPSASSADDRFSFAECSNLTWPSWWAFCARGVPSEERFYFLGTDTNSVRSTQFLC